MAEFYPDSEELDIIHEFCVEYPEHYQAAEAMILQLETTPSDVAKLNDLFRTVHTVKGNSGLLGIHPLVDLLQELESILDLVRNESIQFEPLIGDLTLLILDRCNGFLEGVDRNGVANYDANLFQAVSSQIHKAISADPLKRQVLFGKALSLLDPETTLVMPTGDVQSIFVRTGITESDDLVFIMDMSERAQARAEFWHGRLERVVSWVMALNEKAGAPVEPEQLFVAVCLHDIGMAMLPSAVIHKNQPLTEEELKSVQDHVWVASRLASSFPNWHEAKRIIDHHQEHFDGSGYPLGLKENEICLGAQMLAIVHAFEAITHGYSKKFSRKRPLMRAVMELNRFSDSQFNQELVNSFMEVTKTSAA